VAAVRDLPRNSHRHVTSADGSVFKLSVRAKTDLMRLKTRVAQRIRVAEPGCAPFEFNAEYSQTLWPPKILLDLLQMAGFTVLSINPRFKAGSEATAEDWKITIVSRKEPAGGKGP